MEEWKDIKGFEGLFQVSNYFNVRSLPREIEYLVKGKYKAKRTFPSVILKPFLNKKGYYVVDISYKGKRHKHLVHRLVAEAFIPNPENKPTVNHINHIRTDNRIENLEWATYSEQNDEIWKKNRKEFKHSDETKKKMSESQKNRFETEEPWNKGKKNVYSDETKEKISEANSKQVYQYTLDGELIAIFKNSVVASKETSFPQAMISRKANGKYFSKQRNKWYFDNEYKGYKWSLKPL